jgi:hypothetical protein
MDGLEPDYIAALGRACEEYRATVGTPAYLVGGAAVAIWTAGAFHSADFDLVVAAEDAFHQILLSHGFKPENRQGNLKVGYYHPDHPRFGWQLVTGPLFDGVSDKERAIAIKLRPDSAVTVPPIEDMIADRLGQYEANRNDRSRLNQAELLFQVAKTIDMTNLMKRIADEQGDGSLVETWSRV